MIGLDEFEEGIRDTAISVELVVNKNSPVPVRVGANNLDCRTSILIQPITGDFNFGFSPTVMPFFLSKENFFEIKLPSNLDLYIAPTSGAKKIAVSELK